MTGIKRALALIAGAVLATAQPAFAQQGPVGAFADTAVRDLVGARVRAADGRPVGEVDQVVRQGGKVLAVVGVGGFLGFGEHEVALPLDAFAQDEAGLSLAAYTENDLRALAAWSGEGEIMPLDMTVAGQAAPGAQSPAAPLAPVAPEAPATQ